MQVRITRPTHGPAEIGLLALLQGLEPMSSLRKETTIKKADVVITFWETEIHTFLKRVKAKKN